MLLSKKILVTTNYCGMYRCFCLYLIVILSISGLGACQKYLDAPAMKEEDPRMKPASLVAHSEKVNDVVWGYYSATPGDYSISSNKYPLLVFIHGAGQFGNGSFDLPLLLNEAVPQILEEKKFPPLFIVNGEELALMVLAPQFIQQPTTKEVIEFIEFAVNNYRIDTNRIYLTGFSNGGRTLVDVAADYPTRFAAIVPIAGAANYNLNEKARSIADATIAVWAFHNLNDQLIDHTETKNFITAIKAVNPQLVTRMTLFPGFAGTQAHDAWTEATNPFYKEEGKSIYEWMLQFKR